MTVFNESLPHAGGFLVGEGNKTISRSIGILKSGENLKAGSVVQKEASTGKYIQFDAANSDVNPGPGSFAILFDNVDASGGQKEATFIDKDAEVNGQELIWADDQNTGERETGIAQLLTVGIKLSPGSEQL